MLSTTPVEFASVFSVAYLYGMGISSHFSSRGDFYLLPHFFFFFSSRRRHTRFDCDWSSDVCSSDLCGQPPYSAAGERASQSESQKADQQSQILDIRSIRGIPPGTGRSRTLRPSGRRRRSEERRVGKECRSRWSPYH